MPEPTEPAPDEELIAYLDGELAGAPARAIESQLALDPVARAKADELQKTYDLLDYLPRPEPSPTFASRTVTQLEASPSRTAAYIPAGSAPEPRRAWLWALAGVLALGVGFGLHAGLPPARPSPPPLPLSELSVIENLRFYAGVDDLDYLRQLDDADFFADDEVPAKPPVPEPLSAEQRGAMLARYASLPQVRQEQLRKLNQQLGELDAPQRERLGRVLERYAVWLDRLADADRREVYAAPSASERTDAVRRVKVRAIRDGLPESVRQQLKQLPDAADQTKLIAAYRQQEAEIRTDWELARRQWDVLRKVEKPWPFSDAALAAEVEVYVESSLKPRLSGEEKNALERLAREARPEAGETRPLAWLYYGIGLQRLTDAHPTLPEFGNGTKTIRSHSDLSDDFLKQFGKPMFYRKRFNDLPNRWPDLAEGIAKEAKKLGVTPKPPLGPSKPGEFASALNDWLAAKFFKAAQPSDSAELKKLEGHWPEYPRKLLEVARRADLSVPGVTLPGTPSVWEKYYQPLRTARRSRE